MSVLKGQAASSGRQAGQAGGARQAGMLRHSSLQHAVCQPPTRCAPPRGCSQQAGCTQAPARCSTAAQNSTALTVVLAADAGVGAVGAGGGQHRDHGVAKAFHHIRKSVVAAAGGGGEGTRQDGGQGAAAARGAAVHAPSTRPGCDTRARHACAAGVPAEGQGAGGRVPREPAGGAQRGEIRAGWCAHSRRCCCKGAAGWRCGRECCRLAAAPAHQRNTRARVRS